MVAEQRLPCVFNVPNDRLSQSIYNLPPPPRLGVIIFKISVKKFILL